MAASNARAHSFGQTEINWDKYVFSLPFRFINFSVSFNQVFNPLLNVVCRILFCFVFVSYEIEVVCACVYVFMHRHRHSVWLLRIGISGRIGRKLIYKIGNFRV